MSQPKNQKQHRVSKVYLKEFGYQKNNRWFVSVWEKSKNFTDNVSIDQFTAETNIFDLPVNEIEIKRYFENASQRIEDNYKIVLNTIKHQEILIPKHCDLLCHYIPNLICRTKPYQEYFKMRLQKAASKELFFEEITMFEPNDLTELKLAVEMTAPEFRLNLVLGNIMTYLIRILRSFSFVVLRGISEKGWFTSDNPVIIDTQETEKDVSYSYPYIIPIESEIYFPLSVEYCLFIFHKNSIKQSNPLRKLSINKINDITEDIHDKICNMIVHNGSEFFIFNQEVQKTFLDRE